MGLGCMGMTPIYAMPDPDEAIATIRESNKSLRVERGIAPNEGSVGKRVIGALKQGR